MRFSLKQLFVVVTLIGVGLGMLSGANVVAAIDITQPGEPLTHVVQFFALVALWIGSGAAFGAAIGLMFGRVGTGICLGVVAQFLIGLRWFIPPIR